ncbi:MAG: hypothetical protein KAV82_02895 [Phycisphaerae bacterium]|nr:hypothetical protein [Phycisphaerae bacterium]
MDSKPSGITTLNRTDESGGDARVPCDQAVFTSIRTPTGEGYRLIASSPGLTGREKTEITKHCPSHGGLCGDDERATGLAFYQLPGERLCATFSCTAGKEQSGRGGLRIYTHAVVFDRQFLSAFAYNPFNIFQAMETAGLTTPELKRDKHLPAIELAATPTRDGVESGKAVARVGAEWLGYLLHTACNGERVIVSGADDPRDLIETVLLGIPGPFRADVSFGCGLRFSIGRAFTLTGVFGDITTTKRIIRGQPLLLLHPALDLSPPPFERGAWVRMVDDYWASKDCHALVEFTSQAFPDCSPATLERIAALRNDTRFASSADAAEVLTIANRRRGQTLLSRFEHRLLDDLLVTIRRRLEQLWSQADEAELVRCWPELMTLVGKSPEEAFRQLIPVVGLVLRRLSHTSPLIALEHALEIGEKATIQALKVDLQEVADTARRRLRQAEPGQFKRAMALLDRWANTFPGIRLPGPPVP